MIAATCVTCGREYQTYPSSVKRGRSACSRACGNARHIRSIVVRLEEDVDRSTHPRGCWLWRGSVMPNGYGHFGYLGKNYYPHRASYEHYAGEKIPVGLTIDHLCRNKLCVNPSHLEAVTLAENLLRRFTPEQRERFAQTEATNV